MTLDEKRFPQSGRTVGLGIVHRHQSSSHQRILEHRTRQRSEKTQLDYWVASLSPLLIMLLVGSLVFFLIHVFYEGSMKEGIRWVMFWFVLAIVLVARIGIEQSSAHAGLYGAAVAVATWLFLIKTHPAFLLGVILLALVWWTAHRLVTDCTPLDEAADCTDQGLLEAQRTQGPSPGRWVLYYSLATLPLFGIGQFFLSQTASAPSESGFHMLVTYLCAAAGLLLTTSLMGLRRYLRQRSIKMPTMIARQWMTSGARMVLLVFILALLMPRPGVGQAWMGLNSEVDHVLQTASRWALRFNAPGTGPGRKGMTAESDSGENADRPQPSNASSAQPPASEAKARPSAAQTLPASAPNDRWQRGLRFALYFALLAALLIRYRHPILSTLASLWHLLKDLFKREANRGPTHEPSNSRSASAPTVKRRPFRSFQNPFERGDAERWPPAKLIVYTFRALDAWATEKGSPAEPHLTPLEQVRKWQRFFPQVGDEAIELGGYYCHLTYKDSPPSTFNRQLIGKLWKSLHST